MGINGHITVTPTYVIRKVPRVSIPTRPPSWLMAQISQVTQRIKRSRPETFRRMFYGKVKRESRADSVTLNLRGLGPGSVLVRGVAALPTLASKA